MEGPMTTGKAFEPSRLTRLQKGAAALLVSLLTFVGISAAPTAAAFTDSGSARLSPVTAATVDIAFEDGGREHTVELDASALGPGDSVTGRLRIFNSGSVDTDLSMSTDAVPDANGEPSLADHLLLTVASDGHVLSSGPLLSASFDDGAVMLPAGGSATQGWIELTVTVTLDVDAPVTVAGLDAPFELLFSSSRATFRVSGSVTSTVSSVDTVTFPIASISVGAQHSLVIDDQGGVWAWGYNGRGQLGDGSQVNRFAPVRVAISERVEMVSAGVDTSMALTASGRVLTWGNGDVTGDFSGQDRLTPTEVSGSWSQPVAVATGGFFFLVLDEDGALWSWGNNGGGRLGQKGSSSGKTPTPGRVTAQSLDTARVTGMHASRFAGMAFTSDGKVIGWGDYHNKDTGRTITGLPSVPVREVALSYDARVALLDDGRVFTSSGSGGFVPTSLANITTISSSVAGTTSEMAFIATDGAGVWAWGSNALGQLGLGSGISSVSEPTGVDLSGWGNSPIHSVDLGWQHSVIVSTAGMYSSVGTGTHGELGLGTTTFRATFVGSEAVEGWPGTVPPPVTRASRPPLLSLRGAEENEEPVQHDDSLTPDVPDAAEPEAAEPEAAKPEAAEPEAAEPEAAEPEAEGESQGGNPEEDGHASEDSQSAPETGGDATPPTDVEDDHPLDSDAADALRDLVMRAADDPDVRDLLVRMLEAARRADAAEAASAAEELAHRLDDEGRRLLDIIVVVTSASDGATEAERMLVWLDREEPFSDAP